MPVPSTPSVHHALEPPHRRLRNRSCARVAAVGVMTASPVQMAAVSHAADTSAVALPTPRTCMRPFASPLASGEASQHVGLQHCAGQGNDPRKLATVRRMPECYESEAVAGSARHA